MSDLYNKICCAPFHNLIIYILFSIVAIRAYCEANPGEIKANPVNCAQYFDCGEESIKARMFLRECLYPHVFDYQSSTCVNFTLVDCGKRR